MTSPQCHIIICIIFFICACRCAWHPVANVSLAFLKIYVPSDDGDIFLPVKGNYFIYSPPLNTDYYEFCGVAQQTAVNCTDYFCTSKFVNDTVNWDNSVQAKKYHVMMHNYCNYCLMGNRTVSDFLSFHSVKNSCPNFVPFNFSCGNANDDFSSNFPIMNEISFNYSKTLLPFVCYCGAPQDRYSFQVR